MTRLALSEIQAQAILDLRPAAFNRARSVIRFWQEYTELLETIQEYQAILAAKHASRRSSRTNYWP